MGELATIISAAAMTGTSADHVRDYIRQGKLRVRKHLAGRCYVSVEAVRALIEFDARRKAESKKGASRT